MNFGLELEVDNSFDKNEFLLFFLQLQARNTCKKFIT